MDDRARLARRWRVVLAVLLVGLAAVPVGNAIAGAVTASALAEALAQTRAAGEPTSVAEATVGGPAAPADDAFPAVERALAALPRLIPSGPAMPEEELLYNRSWRTLTDDPAWRHLASSRAHVVGPAVAHLREARRPRFSGDASFEAERVFGPARIVAIAAALEGRPDDALDGLSLCLEALPSPDQPRLRLMRGFVQQSETLRVAAPVVLEHAAGARPEAIDRALDAVARALAREDASRDELDARAIVLDGLAGLRTDPLVTARDLGVSLSRSQLALIRLCPWLLDRDALAFLVLSGRSIELARGPPGAAAFRELTELDARGRLSLLGPSRAITGGFESRFAGARVRQSRLAATGLALEALRHRGRLGAFPATLEALGLPAGRLLDPVSGERFRYTHSAAGIVIEAPDASLIRARDFLWPIEVRVLAR